jgi:hypothetical protein
MPQGKGSGVMSTQIKEIVNRAPADDPCKQEDQPEQLEPESQPSCKHSPTQENQQDTQYDTENAIPTSFVDLIHGYRLLSGLPFNLTATIN